MMTGTWKLCRFILRRDVFRIVIWLTVLGIFAVAIPVVFENLFGSDAERMAMAETMKNPAMTALLGIGFGFDDYQTGQMTAHEVLLMTMLAVGVANILMVVRHTRKTEDLGRLELIAALPVGRMANLSATLLASVIFNAAIVIEHVIIFTALGIDSMPLPGNAFYAFCLGLTGLFFASSTAFFAQIANGSRSTTALAMLFFSLCYMMRAIGDVGNEALSLMSPLGLLMRSKPYVDENAVPLIIVFSVTLAICIPTYILQGRRDMDAGLLPQRSGRSTARKTLLSPLGLAWRLSRGTIIAWGIGLFAFGAMYGSVFGDLEGFLDTSDIIKAVLSNSDYSMTEQFLAMLMSILALAATVPALILALKLRSEEKDRMTDNLASRCVSRPQMMTAYVVLAMLCCAMMNFLTAFGLWIAIDATMQDPFSFQMVLEAGMSYLPAMLVICGLAFALTGVAPRIASATWALLAYGVFAGYLAQLMQLDEWVSLASPFHYVKQLPVQEFEALPLVVLTIIAIALTTVGYIGYRNRDLDG